MKRVLEQRSLGPYVGATIEEDHGGAKPVRLVPDSKDLLQRWGGAIILSPAALDALKAMLARNGL